VSLALALLGCRLWAWTDVEYVNHSQREIWAEVVGVRPDPSPGVLIVSSPSREDATKSSHFGDPVSFDDTFKIVWSVQGSEEKRVMEFQRKDLGIGRRVQGGTFRFVYNADETWTVEYDKWAKD
jgi:hypothetical protein